MPINDLYLTRRGAVLGLGAAAAVLALGGPARALTTLLAAQTFVAVLAQD